MNARKLIIAVAVAFSFSLAAQTARAEEAAKKAAPAAEKSAPAASKAAPSEFAAGGATEDAAPLVQKKKSGKAKLGEACKTHEDCSGSLICGRGKCEHNLVEMHPAT